MNNQTTLSRDSYGALRQTQTTVEADRALFFVAQDAVEQVALAGKIPPAYDHMEWGTSGRERGHRIGDAVRHEIYDITPDGRHILVCARSVEGSRYGQKTTDKSYFIVSRHGRGYRAAPASKAVAAKAAKASGAVLGVAIAVCQGRRPAPVPGCLAPRIGYKIVRRENGKFVSVWDGSEWPVGAPRIEAATPDHRGGFYFYATLDEAIEQALSRQTFADAREYRDLSILEIEASGREFGATKRCATKIKPVREVFAIL